MQCQISRKGRQSVNEKGYTAKKRNAVVKRLQEFIPTYKKSMSGLKELLEDKNAKAIINTKHLDEYNLSMDRKPHQYDYQPSTEIYRILEKL